MQADADRGWSVRAGRPAGKARRSTGQAEVAAFKGEHADVAQRRVGQRQADRGSARPSSRGARRAVAQSLGGAAASRRRHTTEARPWPMMRSLRPPSRAVGDRHVQTPVMADGALSACVIAALQPISAAHGAEPRQPARPADTCPATSTMRQVDEQRDVGGAGPAPRLSRRRAEREALHAQNQRADTDQQTEDERRWPAAAAARTST